MAFKPLKTYKIVTSPTHSTIAIDTSYIANANLLAPYQVRVATKTIDVALKFGTSAAVEADTTITSNALADGNTYLLAGTVELFDLPQGTTHVSVEGFATGPGEVWVVLGYGEKI